MDEATLRKHLNPTQDELNESFRRLSDVSELLQERNYVERAQFFGDLFTAYAKKFPDSPYPDSIESNYTGIHLGNTFEEADLLQLIEVFNRKQTLHAKYVCQVMKEARKVFCEFNKNVRECDLNHTLTDLKGVIVVGDLHGHFKDLYYIIKKFGLPGKNYRFVFNGDFVDRGEQQIEVLVTLLYCFILYPRRVFLNRGNHEDKTLCSSQNFKPCFKFETSKKYGKYGDAVFNEATKTFSYLQVATIVINKSNFRLFVVHGGISNSVNLNQVQSIDRTQYDVVGSGKVPEQLSDLLWSDPILNQSGCFNNTSRGLGKLFGADVSKDFCEKYNFNYIIRSHEVRQEGFSRDHPHVLTIFSCSNYSGGTNKGAVIQINNTGSEYTVHPYKIERSSESETQKQRNHVIMTIKKFLKTLSDQLMGKFKSIDQHRNGYIDIYSWAKIIATILNDFDVQIKSSDIVHLRNYLCPIDDTQNKVFYKEMFTNFYDDSIETSLYLLKIIFKSIDVNGDERISIDEASKAVKVINELLEKKYNVEFFKSMDKNKDGYVDYKEFKDAFLKIA